MCPLDPTLQIRHPQLTPGAYAATVPALNTAAILRLRDRPPMGEGSSVYQGDPRLGRVGWPDIYWASLGGQLSSHVGLCNECMLDSQ